MRSPRGLLVVFAAFTGCDGGSTGAREDEGIPPAVGGTTAGGGNAGTGSTSGSTSSGGAAGAGSGSSGGTGGNGATAPVTDGGGAVGGLYGWLADPSKRTTYSVTEPCRTSLVKPAPGDWQPRVWNSCGPGCERSNVMPGPATTKGKDMGTAFINWEAGPQLAVSATLYLGLILTVIYVDDFSDAGPRWVLFEEGACRARLSTESSSGLLWIDPFEPGPTRFGRIKNDAIEWLSPTVDSGYLLTFTTRDDWGNVGADSVIQIGETPGSSIPTTVYEPPGGVSRVSTTRDTAAWTENSFTAGSVGLWSRSLGGRSIGTSPDAIATTAVGADRVVWVAARGPDARSGTYESTTVRWAPLDGSAVHDVFDTTLFHSIPARAAYDGKWFAFTACNETLCNPIVVDLERNEAWYLRATAGTSLAQPAGIRNNQLIGLGRSSSSLDAIAYDQLLRWDLNQLPSYANRL